MSRRLLVPLAASFLLLAVTLPACSKKTTSPTAGGGGGGGGATKELNSGSIAGGGGAFPHTFTAAGVFPYHCAFHGGMTGTVTVSAGAPMSVSVNIAGFAFSPQSITVGTNGTVTWTNNDGTAHTVTSD